VLDLKIVSAEHVIGLALVTISLGATYFLLKRKAQSNPNKPLKQDK
jgi:uncharacterized membrane protein (DUF373 family)